MSHPPDYNRAEDASIGSNGLSFSPAVCAAVILVTDIQENGLTVSLYYNHLALLSEKLPT